MAQLNLTPLQREVQGLFAKPGGKTVANLQVLYDSTMSAWQSVQESWGEGSILLDSLSDADRATLEAEAKRFEIRMLGYAAALERGNFRKASDGLLYNRPGSGHHVPDFLFPWSWLNMARAAQEQHTRAWARFKSDLSDGFNRAVVKPLVKAGKTASVMASLTPVLLTAAGIVLGGYVLHKLKGGKE